MEPCVSGHHVLSLQVSVSSSLSGYFLLQSTLQMPPPPGSPPWPLSAGRGNHAVLPPRLPGHPSMRSACVNSESLKPGVLGYQHQKQPGADLSSKWPQRPLCSSENGGSQESPTQKLGATTKAICQKHTKVGPPASPNPSMALPAPPGPDSAQSRHDQLHPAGLCRVRQARSSVSTLQHPMEEYPQM